MLGDIKLDAEKDGWVTIEADVVNAKASDFILEQNAYRTDKGGPFRRALVHNSNDGLTVNFGGDYPDGVTITEAKLNLKVDIQVGGPKLPKNGKEGDLIAIKAAFPRGLLGQGAKVDFIPSLWLCVESVHGERPAQWRQVPLSDEVVDGSG